MKRALDGLVVILIVSLGTGCAGHAGPPLAVAGAAGGPGVLRIGVYDSRAIAVAYAASPFHSKAVATLAEEKRAADAAADGGRAGAITTRGAALQTQLHLQGFGRARVDELLDPVRGRLPEVAARAGVRAIVADTDWRDASVEAVDVTDDLVGLYEPTPRTLKTVKDLRGKRPVPMLDILVAERSGGM